MNRADKVLGALSLCRKAGKLRIGFDAVGEAAKKGEAKLLLAASDVSPGSVRRLQNACQNACAIWRLPFTQSVLAAVTVKPAGLLAVADEGLAGMCRKALEEAGVMAPGSGDDTAQKTPENKQ